MALCTAADVQAICPQLATLATTAIDPFITTADLVVQEELTTRNLSQDRLSQIECYLAAHFAIVAYERGGLNRQRIGESEDFYHEVGGDSLNLMATRYGQQAVFLDSSGRLGGMSKSTIKARFRVVHTRHRNDDWTGANTGDAE